MMRRRINTVSTAIYDTAKRIMPRHAQPQSLARRFFITSPTQPPSVQVPSEESLMSSQTQLKSMKKRTRGGRLNKQISGSHASSMQDNNAKNRYAQQLLSDSFLQRLGFDVDGTAAKAADGSELDPALAEFFENGPPPPTPEEEAQSAPVVFDASQEAALTAGMEGKNIFVTGGAGTGKTLIVRELVSRLRASGKNVAVTATTGVAALNCGGSTLHHFVGLNKSMQSLSPEETAVKVAANRNVSRRLKITDVLVIDEVSMLESSVLERVHFIAQYARGNLAQPFGGLQMILCGDFLQLPPISQRKQAAPYAFFSPLWTALNLTVVHLETKFRQRTDHTFQSILDAVREAKLSKEQEQILANRVRSADDVDDTYVRLFGSNLEVDAHNLKRFSRLTPRMGEPVTDLKPLFAYNCLDMKSTKGSNGVNLSDGRFAQMLALKVGTRVMLLQNMNVKGGLVNGTSGVVSGFLHPLEGLVLVKHIWDSRRRGAREQSSNAMQMEDLMARSGFKSQTAAFRMVDGVVNRPFFGSMRLQRDMPPPHLLTLDMFYTVQQISDLLQVSHCPIPVEKAGQMTLEQWQEQPSLRSLRFPVVCFDTPNCAIQPMLPVLLTPGKEEWYVGEDLVGSRTQLPIRHAWAMTVHKSQGLTIGRLAVDMNKFFAPGQGYVALSRGVSLDGLVLTNFSPRGIFSCSIAKSFYSQELAGMAGAASQTASSATSTSTSSSSSAVAPEMDAQSMLDEFGFVPPEEDPSATNESTLPPLPEAAYE